MPSNESSASKLSYKKLRDELDEVMFGLQAEDLDIDEALELYKRGQKLISDLEVYLKTAENTVKEIKAKFNKT
jgi:exodeoxyribonuclease VII small subunit